MGMGLPFSVLGDLLTICRQVHENMDLSFSGHTPIVGPPNNGFYET